MIRQAKASQHPTESALAVRLAFAATIALFVASTLPSNWRIWGLSSWKQLPAWAVAILVGVGLFAFIAEMRSKRLLPLSGASEHRDKDYWIACSVLGVVFVSAFCLLRGSTHFLGDGYLILSNLAKDFHTIKSLELGESLIHSWLKDLLPGTADARVLLTYQIVSIGSGFVFVLLTILGAYRLFTDNLQRILLCLGVLSGGYMLQFFGYVENYSVFLVSLAAFTGIGLLATEGRIKRWWILLPMGLAIFLHVIGVLLVPAAGYVLLLEEHRGLLRHLRKGVRWGIVVALVMIVLTAYVYFYNTSIFFRLAFLPLVASPFTVPGYTLFGPKHLADFGNLLMQLVPGFLVLALALPFAPMRTVRAGSETRFLTLLVLCTLAGSFLLDPKLGMARDWDLFSFCGIPLSVLLYWVVLKFVTKPAVYRAAAGLAIAAGFLSLVPRVITQYDSQQGIALLKSYLELDPARARTGMYVLGAYYASIGDTAAANATEAERGRRYPAEAISRQAYRLIEDDRTYEAKSCALRALQIDATMSGAWVALSKCYVLEKKYDSALLTARMANGLNPGNHDFENNLALAYCYNHQTAQAEKIWLKLTRDSALYYVPWMNLARMYQLQGNQQQYKYCLEHAASLEECSPSLIRELAEWYAKNREMGRAAETISLALARGLDSASYQSFVAKYPSSATAR